VKPATCSEKGTDLYECKDCKAQKNETTSKLAHTMGWVVKKEASCTQEGYELYECVVCHQNAINSRTIAKTPHNWNRTSSTCTEQQVCLDCGYVGQDLKEHTWKVDSSKSVAATVNKEGKEVSVCTECGITETKTLPKLTETTTAEADSTAASKETQPPRTTEEETSSSESESESESASLPALSADNHILIFSEASDTKQIKLLNLVKDSSIQVSFPGTASSWIKVGGSGNVYTVRALANSGNSVRKGVITFTDTSNGRTLNIEVQQSNAKGCVVSFNVNGGRGQIYLQSKTVVPGTQMKGIFPAKVDAPAYKMFDGWYSAPEGGVRYTESSVCPNVDKLTLFAHWTNKTYKIKYDGNGAERGSMENTPAVCNTKIDVAENGFIKTGYTVEAWTTNPDGSGTKILANGGKAYNLVAPYAEPGTTVTLYAKWIPKKDVKVNFDADDGVIVEPGTNNRTRNYTKNVEYKAAYGTLPTAVHPQGKIFGGWKDEMGRIVDESSTVFNANNHSLRAVWTTRQYTIKFNGNKAVSGSMNDLVFQQGDGQTLPACLFDEGTKFDCWCTAPDRSGYTFAVGASVDEVLKKTNQSEITLYALWFEHEYSIIYYDGFTGQEIATVNKSQVGHRYTAIEAPTIPGLRFAGWMLSEDFPLGQLPLLGENDVLEENLFFKPGQYKVIDLPEKHSKTLYVYSIYERSNKNAYSIIYHPYDGNNCPAVDNFSSPGKKSVTTADPNKDGYVFFGWTEYPGVTASLKKEVELSDYQRCVVLYPDWVWTERVLKLKDGFDGKQDAEMPLILPGETTFVLNSRNTPKRDDYDFGGWKAQDGTIYPEGSEVEVPAKGLELTATWNRKMYTMNYYDSQTGELLFTETLRSDQNLSYTPPELGGFEFKGWIDYPKTEKIIPSGALVSSFVDTGKKKTVFTLKTSYKAVGVEKGKITVLYYWAGKDVTNGPTEPTYGDATSGEIKLTTVHPDKTGCVFNGWAFSPKGNPSIGADRKYYTVSVADRQSSVVKLDQFGNGVLKLYACWKSQYSCTLEPNGFPGIKNAIVISGLPGTEVHLSDYSKLFKKKGNFYLSGWGETKDSITYMPEDTFTIPYKDYVLYAIPKNKSCTIKYMDGFSGIQIGSAVTVNMGEEITPPAEAPFYSGYEFIGWSYDIRDMRIEEAYPKDADLPIGQSITIQESIELYATYRTIEAPEGVFRIIYNPNGGVGGPGTVLLSPGEHTVDVTHEPSNPGYTFEGWHPVNYRQYYVLEPEFPKDKVSKISSDEYGMDVTLYAVWKEEEGNTVRDILQSEYDASMIPNDHFEREYTSPVWERIDGTTYYIVRTKRAGNSQTSKSYISTAFVLKFENGDWVLRSYGTNEPIYENVKLSILMSHTNNTSMALEFAFMAAETFSDVATDAISIYCPAFGYVVKGAKYMAKVEELMKTREEYEELSEFVVDALKDQVVDMSVDKLKGEMIGRAFKLETESEEMQKKMLESLLNLYLSAEQAMADDINSGKDGLDPFGSYDRALEIFRNRVSSNGFGDLANQIPDCIKNIFLYVYQR